MYAYNHPETPVKTRNIQRLSAKDITSMKVDTILMSPPCQPFTRVGNKKDIADARSNALVAICEMLNQLPLIQYILMENVKGFETSQMHDFYIESLSNAGFDYQEFILSPTQIGVPNMRQRYYCLARKVQKPFRFKQTGIQTEIPNLNSVADTPTIDTIMECDNKNLNDYLLNDDILQKRVLVLDIVYPKSTKTMCFTKAYTHYAEGTGSVFCPYKKNVLTDTFTVISTMPITSIDRLEELKKLQLRYFTPLEVTRLMSFPSRFLFPSSITNRQRYRLLGNSINVAVVTHLINILFS